MSKKTDTPDAALSGDDAFFQPVSAIEMPRFAGMPSFMRLPHLELDAPRIDEVEMGLVGVPWDAGTTNRPGPRHGPRQLRDLSTMIRALNPVTGVNPFATVNCADLGDVGPNPIDLADSMARITSFYSEISRRGIAPMTAGGDHLVSLPVLRGLKAGMGPTEKREGHKRRILLHGFCRNRKINSAFRCHLRDLLWTPLLHFQGHIRVFLNKL